MLRFIASRFMTSIFSVLGATIMIFILVQFHNDPRELFVPDSGWGMTQQQWDNLGERLGLDKPLVIQYLEWLGRTLRGDLGISLARQMAVVDLLKGKIGATVQLAVGGWLFAVLLGIPLGVVAAVKRGSFWDYVARLMALVGQAAPPFVTGLLLIWVFSVWIEWFPSGGRSPEFDWKDYVLPCIALGWGAAAGLMRLTRSSMLEVLDSEYIRLARAKGVDWNWVIYKHALRNALIAPVTSMFIMFASWLNGALVIEIVFSWPGIGYDALFLAVNDNDFPLLLGTVFVFILIYLVFAAVADIAYTLIDPRVRLGSASEDS
ncbi:MAG: ABC transporter permease [SAR202 cluster bacterium]|jgi:peptide/nickel transport system permease protein|nr:ABC transporter permease [Dehalococcoidia bacterium]MQG47515.1 ABC transporter permease [SAR202 cluster bacterium]